MATMPDIFVDENDTNEGPPAADTARQQQIVPQPETNPLMQWREQYKDKISLMNEKPGNPGVFTAFAVTPEKIQFQDQEPNERILLLLRRHFITNLPWITISVLLLLAPLLLIPIIRSDLANSFLALVSPALLPVALGLYYLIVLGFMLNQFATWFYQVGLITSIRVVDVDFNTILARNIAYTDLTDIVDTEAHQHGLLQGIFDFGDVGLQTAGEKENFEFTSIPQPNKVVDVLSDLMRDKKKL